MYKKFRVDCYGVIVYCKATTRKEAINNFKKICLNYKISGFKPENVEEVSMLPKEIKPYECLICAIRDF